MNPKILLVIPAFNEGERLPGYLDQLLPDLLRLQGVEISVQVVDDGSRPEQMELLRRDIEARRSAFPFLQPLLALAVNRGKGGAILEGWESSKDADFYTFLDADGAIPSYETVRLLVLLKEGNLPRSIFASRIKMLGKKLERDTSRHYVGRIFAFWVGIFINGGIYDSQCGFKILPAEHWQIVRPFLSGHRFAFDVELLAALSINALPIEEVPIDWKDIAGSKVSLFRDSFRMFRSVLSIHGKMKNGYYRKRPVLGS